MIRAASGAPHCSLFELGHHVVVVVVMDREDLVTAAHPHTASTLGGEAMSNGASSSSSVLASGLSSRGSLGSSTKAARSNSSAMGLSSSPSSSSHAQEVDSSSAPSRSGLKFSSASILKPFVLPITTSSSSSSSASNSAWSKGASSTSSQKRGKRPRRSASENHIIAATATGFQGFRSIKALLSAKRKAGIISSPPSSLLSLSGRLGSNRKRVKSDEAAADGGSGGPGDGQVRQAGVRRPFVPPFRRGEGEEGSPSAGGSLGMRRIRRVSALHSPDADDALVLFTPTQQEQLLDTKRVVHVVVDPLLSRFLRKHQRAGVKFMWDCLHGHEQDVRGCILADDMGLGKTLQSITIMWTLLRQGPLGVPTCRNALVLCPSSLVSNWANEISKWLGTRMSSFPVTSSSRKGVKKVIDSFFRCHSRRCPVLIISYEGFRSHAEQILGGDVQLVVCDEGHKLKGTSSALNNAVMQFRTPRRILLTGTPVQNNLDEFYALVSFVSPSLLGTPTEFRRNYANAIQLSRDPDCSGSELKRGRDKGNELVELVSNVMLRRTNATLTQFLPPKAEMVVFCGLKPLQQRLYKKFLQSKEVRKAMRASIAGKQNLASSLASITTLTKLCNHPTLIFEDCVSASLLPPLETIIESGARSAQDTDTKPEPPKKKPRSKSKPASDVATSDAIVSSPSSASLIAQQRPPATAKPTNATDESDNDNGDDRNSADEEMRVKVLKQRIRKQRGGFKVPVAAGGTIGKPMGAALFRQQQLERRKNKGKRKRDVSSGKRNVDHLRGLLETYPNDFHKEAYSPEHSAKMHFLCDLLLIVKRTTNDRVVVVSNYTQTLDIMEKVFSRIGIRFLRLDGSLATSKRQSIVDLFNAPSRHYDVLLLSSKAGGCGLNIIGANRLVAYDIDWNPANDAQSMARVWRDGQKRSVYIYRLISTGTLEEKMFQRQLFKMSMAETVVKDCTEKSLKIPGEDDDDDDNGVGVGIGVGGGGGDDDDDDDDDDFVIQDAPDWGNEGDKDRRRSSGSSFGDFRKEDLRAIFEYNENTICDTQDRVRGEFTEWKRFSALHLVEDNCLIEAGKDIVTYVFAKYVKRAMLKKSKE